MKNDSSPDDPASEQQRLLAEAVALGRRSEVRQAELAALETRIHRAAEEEDRRLEERLAASKQSSVAVAPRPSRGSRLLVLVLLVYSLAGLPLVFTVGYGFVFAFADKYWAMAHWTFFSVLAVIALALLQIDARRWFREQYPNWMKRWLMPAFMAVFVAGLFVYTTPGWAALFGWIAGGPVTALEAQVVSVGSVSTSAKGGCRQTAKLLANDVLATLCLDGRAPTPVPAASEQVLLVGRNSWFGLLVHEIRRR